jgi:hypothetical protein
MSLLLAGSESDSRLLALVRSYLLAKQQVIASGYEAEITWQETVTLESVTPRSFLQEAAWVVLCTGMRESTVSARFGRLTRAFGNWDPKSVARNKSRCRRRAQAIFNHPAKLDAIICIAEQVDRLGIDSIVSGIRDNGPEILTRLPYIGPATCFHLAKNLGYPVAKPDRHLERMAAAVGYADAFQFCTTIATALDEPVQVVDLVMWRYATIDSGYLSWLRSGTEHHY